MDGEQLIKSGSAGEVRVAMELINNRNVIGLNYIPVIQRGSTFQSNEQCTREVKKSAERVKMFETSAVIHGLDTVALTKKQQAELEVIELKMLTFSLGVTGIRNESSEVRLSSL